MWWVTIVLESFVYVVQLCFYEFWFTGVNSACKGNKDKGEAYGRDADGSHGCAGSDSVPAVSFTRSDGEKTDAFVPIKNDHGVTDTSVEL
ncbi:hypothetical protein M513_11637 [Trichuris suis]|uniref:Uncharacterized protein n=1 Tax=Trichuris suis TaxID=68888 RepID=A0A085LR80_9BILA|nr:hypothetical protein M513_11637 [Trichuris suis]